MKRVILIVLGALAAMVAVGMLVGGVVLLAIVGSDGFVDTGTHAIGTRTYALVSESTRITDAAEQVGDLGDVTIRIRVAPNASGAAAFVGIARNRDVARYLGGVEHEAIRDLEFDPFRLRTSPAGGGLVFPAPPGSETFWDAQASGTGTVTLDWKVQDGNWRVVIMNTDATPDVRVDGLLGVKVPFLRPLGIVLVVVGALALVLGVVLIVLGIVAKPRTPAPPSPDAFASTTSGTWPAGTPSAPPSAPEPPVPPSPGPQPPGS